MSARTKKNDYLVQGSVLAIAGIITRLIGMLYRIPLTRIVGSEGMGYYNTAYEIYNLALLISTYSIPVALSKLIAMRDSKKEYKNSFMVFRVASLIAVVIGALFSILLLVFADKIADAIKWPSAAIPLRFLAPTIFVFSLMGVLRGLFQGKRTMIPTALSQVIEQIFNAITSVVAALLLVNAFRDTNEAAAYGAAGGTIGTLAGAVAGFLFLLFVFGINRDYFARKAESDISSTIETRLELGKAVVLTMLPIILSQTIYQISGIIDNMMFGNIMEGKGMIEKTRAIMWEAYSNKYKWLYNVPVAVASAFGVSIVPVLSGIYGEGRLKPVKEKIAASIKLNMIIAIPAAVGLAVLAKPILLLLFNNEQDELSPKLMMLGAVAVIFFALSTLTNGILQGVNHMKIPVINSAISLVIHIPIIYVCVDVLELGAYGMVIGNVTYGLLVCILNRIYIRRLLDYRQEIKTTFVIPFLSAGIMGAVSFGVYRLLYLLIPSNTLAVMVSLIVAAAVYFVMLILLRGLNRDEILDLPKGRVILRIAERIRIIRH